MFLRRHPTSKTQRLCTGLAGLFPSMALYVKHYFHHCSAERTPGQAEPQAVGTSPERVTRLRSGAGDRAECPAMAGTDREGLTLRTVSLGAVPEFWVAAGNPTPERGGDLDPARLRPDPDLAEPTCASSRDSGSHERRLPWSRVGGNFPPAGAQTAYTKCFQRPPSPTRLRSPDAEGLRGLAPRPVHLFT